VTWQPALSEGGEPDPVSRPGSRRGRSWAAVVVLLAVGLCGLAAAAAGVAHEVLPRQFSAAQQQQIMAWEMSRRWRAMSAGEIFPAAIGYQVPADALQASQGLELSASRLGIARQGACSADVSVLAAKILTAGHCLALLRATYVDASQSMVVTIGVAVLPGAAQAALADRRLSAPGRGLTLAVGAFAVPGTAAGAFRDRQRQLSDAVSEGPYVIMSAGGFADGRQHVQLSSDDYYDQEMTSLIDGLADSVARHLGATPPVPKCPGAPGC
jgi:hypothetical protein